MAKTLSVDVWSDIACPWCYVGKRRLESALLQFAHAENVVVRWHAFQLDPAAPLLAESDVPYAERLARKYSTTTAGAQEMIDRMVGVAADEGIVMDFEHFRPSNTFDAHRLLHAAQPVGLQDALKERLFRAYLCEGKAMGDHDAIGALARDVGLSADEVAGVLHTDLHADGVRNDKAEAAAMGVTGVPFFVIGRRYAIAGAQPAALLLQALERAWHELPEATPAADGATCGPDGCT